MPSNTLFLVNVRAVFMTQLTSEFLGSGTTTVLHVYAKVLVMVTFLLSTFSETAGLPSSTISMVQRTAIRVSVSFIFKQLTMICLKLLGQILGCLCWAWIGP